MPRIRTFKPEFFRSPDTAKASHTARLLFLAMWSWADDHGIGETNLHGLLGFAFPDEDEIGVKDLPQLLAETRGSWGVRFYTHRGRSYYAIPSFDRHQKTEKRAMAKNPGPDDPDSMPDLRFQAVAETGGSSAAIEGVSGTGTGEQGNRGTVKGNTHTASASAPESDTAADGPKLIAEGNTHTGPTPISEDWKPTERERMFAASKGITDVDEQAERFRDWYLADGRSLADWDARFRTWLSDPRRKRAQPAAAPTPTTESDIHVKARTIVAEAQRTGDIDEMQALLPNFPFTFFPPDRPHDPDVERRKQAGEWVAECFGTLCLLLREQLANAA